MPRTYEEIIEEILKNAEGPSAGPMGTLMQDPSQMKDTMGEPFPYDGAPMPNADMMYNPQSYETMNRPPPRGPLDKLERGEPIDDAKTYEQLMRDRRAFTENFRGQRTPVINPDTQPDSANTFARRNEFGQMLPLEDEPPPQSPQEPKSLPPISYYGTPQIDPDEFTARSMKKMDAQEGNSTMQELMDFYTQGGEYT